MSITKIKCIECKNFRLGMTYSIFSEPTNCFCIVKRDKKGSSSIEKNTVVDKCKYYEYENN